jgi:hypothetical protein
MRASDLVGKLRDTATETELARYLRGLPEKQAFEFIIELLGVHEPVALEMAQRCLRNKDSFYRLLARGLELADASSIFRWLACVVPRLGPPAVLRFLTEHIDDFPRGVGRALYFLPAFTGTDGQAQALFAELHRLAGEKGLLLSPRVSHDASGKPVFGPIEDEPTR